MMRNQTAKASLALLPLLCLSFVAIAQGATPSPEQPAEPVAATPDASTPGSPELAAATAEAPAVSDGTATSASDAEVAEMPTDAAAAPTEEQTVLRAQVLLDRANFSPGEIDGRSGSNFTMALAGFQRSRGLDDDGRLGPATWTALETGAAPTLVDYTVLDKDVAGPFAALPKDLVERSKLPALGYESVEEALGERFHASPKLLASLNPGKSLGTAGEVIRVPNVLDAAAPQGATQVIVDKSDKVLLLADKDGTTLAQFPSSTGSSHDPLPVGDWKVNAIAVNPTFHYNPDLFWDANPTHEKAKLPAGPNNPVGVVWIDLSKEHYGIHGTTEPSRVGKTESHGCIRVTNWTAQLLSQSVKAGMPVVLRE